MRNRRLLPMIVLVAAFGPFVAVPANLAVASVQEDDVCWDPDIEFPTSCDDEE